MQSSNVEIAHALSRSHRNPENPIPTSGNHPVTNSPLQTAGNPEESGDLRKAKDWNVKRTAAFIKRNGFSDYYMLSTSCPRTMEGGSFSWWKRKMSMRCLPPMILLKVLTCSWWAKCRQHSCNWILRGSFVIYSWDIPCQHQGITAVLMLQCIVNEHNYVYSTHIILLIN